MSSEKCICEWDKRQFCGCFRAGVCDKPAAPVIERQPTPIGESTARLMHAHTLGEFADEGGSDTVESLAVESYDAQQEITGDENDPESYMAGYCAALYEQAQPLLHLLAAPPELQATIARLKQDHQHMVDRNAMLRQRPDLPVDRIPAHDKLVALAAENGILQKQLGDRWGDISALQANVEKLATEIVRLKIKIECLGGEA